MSNRNNASVPRLLADIVVFQIMKRRKEPAKEEMIVYANNIAFLSYQEQITVNC